ncbi:hypothetical protein [Natronobacterium texcoconense]|uniref:Uncharacterized protein n=1 Tax=Natronobacterium texcoconense TaxID=1095778 RepID=A0A1H1IP71_NATTX|nr:hypothetical protein [Natronobacterium texcoconense]SDR39531.1 hypothetical protein SAMN04489842_3687 [Natronobacterium texcoconense]
MRSQDPIRPPYTRTADPNHPPSLGTTIVTTAAFVISFGVTALTIDLLGGTSTAAATGIAVGFVTLVAVAGTLTAASRRLRTRLERSDRESERDARCEFPDAESPDTERCHATRASVD